MLKIKEYELAAQCFRVGQDDLRYLQALVYQGCSFEQIQSNFEELGIDDVLNFVYKQPIRVTWLRRFNKLYALHLTQKTKVIDRLMNSIDEMKE